MDAVKTQNIFMELAELPDLIRWANTWLSAKRAEGVTAGTLKGYSERVEVFLAYCAKRGVASIAAIDAGIIREWLLELTDGHKPSTVRGYFRAARAWLYWYEFEIDDPAFRNPMRRVKSPKVPDALLDPVELADVQAMLATCQSGRNGIRDRSILRVLLDTGARAAELCAFDLADFDPVTGELSIQRGKGGKGRRVYVGQSARRAARAWLKVRGAAPGALFFGRPNERLHYGGLRAIIERRAALAGLDEMPSAHDFRRACAINLLKNGADLLTVSRLLGHAALQVTSQYLKQTTDDLRASHAANSPVDRGGL